MQTPNYGEMFRKYIYPLYETTLRGRSTFKYYKEYEKNQWLSPDEIKHIQWVKLKKLLEHSYKNVEYYKQQWRNIGATPKDIKTLDDYRRLPILDKQMIRQHYDELIAKNHHHSTRTKKTGGSTGVPLRFEFDDESDQRRNAVMWRGYRWAGNKMGNKSLYIWGAPIDEEDKQKKFKDACYNYITRKKILNSFALSENTINEYVEQINRYKPINLVGYVAPLIIIGKYIQKESLTVANLSSIITGAEILHEFQRELLEDVFNCPVYNTYGCREFMLIASECGQSKGLHINTDHLLVETIDDNGNEINNKPGKVIITDLHNYGMPFIRYINGDIAVLDERICDCGRGLPIMSSIQGRELDIIRTPDGRIVPGEYFPHLIKEISSIKEFQVVQYKLNKIKIYLVLQTGGLAVSDERYLRNKISNTLGDKVYISFEYLDKIPRTNTGKLRVTMSCLSDC